MCCLNIQFGQVGGETGKCLREHLQPVVGQDQLVEGGVVAAFRTRGGVVAPRELLQAAKWFDTLQGDLRYLTLVDGAISIKLGSDFDLAGQCSF